MAVIRIAGALLWAAASLLFGADNKPVPPPAVEVTLKDADKVRVLILQRRQYKALAAREKAKAEELAQQRELDDANGQMAVLQEGLRKDYKCPGCELVEDLRLIRPLPKEVTVLPNR